MLKELKLQKQLQNKGNSSGELNIELENNSITKITYINSGTTRIFTKGKMTQDGNTIKDPADIIEAVGTAFATAGSGDIEFKINGKVVTNENLIKNILAKVDEFFTPVKNIIKTQDFGNSGTNFEALGNYTHLDKKIKGFEGFLTINSAQKSYYIGLNEKLEELLNQQANKPEPKNVNANLPPVPKNKNSQQTPQY
jgi:hypothetical protein